MTRLVVAAAVRLYRDGLASSLAARDGFCVVATAASSAECVERAAAHAPSVVLLETAMPGGLEAARALAGTTPVLALAVPEEVDDVLACAEAGVAGYVTRDAGLDQLVAAIHAAARGELLTSPRMTGALLRRVADLAAARPSATDARLTIREREILDLIHAGLSNKQIAQRLSIQLSTVKNHVHNILEKLGVERRADAAALRGSRSM
jgi:DNA-binding NarL/FixJ family response regulator